MESQTRIKGYLNLRRVKSPEIKEMLKDLQKCTFLPGSWDKRFIRSVTAYPELTEAQEEWIRELHYKYRRQHGRG